MTEVLKLRKSNCKNCYKCIRHCPVKSIRFSENQAHIVGDECILCGQCFVVCPQNAKEIQDDIDRVQEWLSAGEPVIASVAPSFVANYEGVTIEAMRRALQTLGFAGAEETAVGATLVKMAYEDMLKEGRQPVVISSCCHTVNLLISKYYPDVLPCLAPVLSPMQAHAQTLRRAHPGVRVVFIGPCISKKAEAEQYPGLIDAVLTFEELTRLMERKNVVFEADDTPPAQESRARLFPTAGGILKTMVCDQADYDYISIDGLDNCIQALKDIQSGGLSGCFIEMSACTGSCIGGPVMDKARRLPIRDRIQVDRVSGDRDFPVARPTPGQLEKAHAFCAPHRQRPGAQTIQDILRQMGKTKPEDELNCGSCGYDTCREKAIAVYQGKADLSMCLPFLKEKAESFSDTIVSNTPNGILVLNDQLEIQQINEAACRMLRLKSAAEIIGEPVVRLLDPTVFWQVLHSGEPVKDERMFLSEYGLYVEQTVLYDKSYRMLMCMLRDVTEEETQRAKKEAMRQQTVAITDKVVEKQMRVVQEIASLLGETTAQTKIALTKLKESLHEE